MKAARVMGRPSARIECAVRRPVSARSRRQTRYQILVLIAVVGLILLAVASTGLVASTPAPT